MPTFEIRVDGIAVARPSEASMFGFEAYVLVLRDLRTTLGVHGSIKSENNRSLVEWVSRSIPPGCTIEVAYLSNERDDIPDPTPSELRSEIEKHKAEVKAIIKKVKETRGADGSPQQRNHSELVDLSVGLEVTIPPAKPISAVMAAEETLQAVLTWTQGKCNVAVDSITVLPGGHTKGTSYLACALDPGQQLTVKYVA